MTIRSQKECTTMVRNVVFKLRLVYVQLASFHMDGTTVYCISAISYKCTPVDAYDTCLNKQC